MLADVVRDLSSFHERSGKLAHAVTVSEKQLLACCIPHLLIEC